MNRIYIYIYIYIYFSSGIFKLSENRMACEGDDFAKYSSRGHFLRKIYNFVQNFIYSLLNHVRVVSKKSIKFDENLYDKTQLKQLI